MNMICLRPGEMEGEIFTGGGGKGRLPPKFYGPHPEWPERFNKSRGLERGEGVELGKLDQNKRHTRLNGTTYHNWEAAETRVGYHEEPYFVQVIREGEYQVIVRCMTILEFHCLWSNHRRYEQERGKRIQCKLILLPVYPSET